jgi:hypothetical protein
VPSPIEELVRTIDYGELKEHNDSGVLFFWAAAEDSAS